MTEIAALDVPDVSLDDEITGETVAFCNAVVLLEIEAHDETVVKTEVLRDCIGLKDVAGLRDSTDAEDDDVILRVAIDERDKNGEDVIDKEATDEMLT